MNQKTSVEITGNPDVLDIEQYKRFLQKRDEWMSWLSGKDSHAIQNQISSLLWDYTLFLTFNDLWQDAAHNPVAGVGLNGPTIDFLTAGFVATQATAIRRLTEATKWKNPKKHVISLTALVADMKSSRDLVTREAYLASHGQRYEVTSLSGCKSEMAHASFDKLSKTSPTARSREDLVSLQWFDKLQSKLSSCENVCTFVDKFIAHAATPFSRAHLTAHQTKVTLSSLAECHKVLLQVAEFITGRIIGCAFGASIPTPQFDPVENLDKAWTTNKERAREFWERNFESVERWESDALNDFEKLG